MNDTFRELSGFSNHYKVIALASWVFGLGWFAYFALTGAPYTFLIAWGSLSMVLPYGLKGITAWLSRQSAAVEVAAVGNEAKTIIERRASGDGTFEPTE